MARTTTSRGGSSLFTGRGGGDEPVTVSELAAMVKAALVTHLPPKVRVVGEVSNLSDRSHWFFSLKDENATLRCVCFASVARRVSFPVHDGLEVVLTGRVEFYDAQGQVQVYVDKIEPVGVGELELRFRALCQELRKLGYFDAEHKQPVPAMPRRVAVVTSRAAAALQDIIDTAGRRWAGCELMLVDVRVQGEAAAAQIADALRALSVHGPALGVDTIILTRGGGSIEDLWAFNERIVADAVFECELPIVAAIGHETDTTVAELVADVRCATPTQAAMHVIPDRAMLSQQVAQLSQRLALNLARRIDYERQRLRAAARHPFFRRPSVLVDQSRQRLAQVIEALGNVLPRRIASARQHVDALARQLVAIGPANVLERGYTYTLNDKGGIVRSAGDVHGGDRVTTVLTDGRFDSRVETSGRAAPRREVRGRKRPATDEPDLFDLS
ncbi:MAG: exodeoxyribonuclease VII large subunit [Phycisphaeraceae bacterium]|nr:exodeoxyribonuclease VII large subunit [Phycisphaeraceae bacterium]MDP7346615.1 exodeoxyribonuclease VII large subunit [Phycisphaeraceae bacterium]